uniref:Uncharacterized protein n=1 Tax=Sphaerodactylus townsendi TaxID=933632 RepID=A0ACB8EEL6_9SAUR
MSFLLGSAEVRSSGHRFLSFLSPPLVAFAQPALSLLSDPHEFAFERLWPHLVADKIMCYSHSEKPWAWFEILRESLEISPRRAELHLVVVTGKGLGPAAQSKDNSLSSCIKRLFPLGRGFTLRPPTYELGGLGEGS